MLLSPLGVFDFDDAGEMRVVSLHDGVCLTSAEAPGLDLAVPDARRARLRRPAEIAVLRQRVDMHGTLRASRRASAWRGHSRPRGSWFTHAASPSTQTKPSGRTSNSSHVIATPGLVGAR